MLALAGFAMIITFMVLIMTNRLSAITALLLVPVAFAVLTGFSAQMGTMMLDGIRNIAPTGIMLVFAILYFGLMTDAGLFDPVISRIQRVAHGDPMKIIIGTALLALLVSLDGDGATTYIIVVTAMLPLYRRLGINTLILTCMNMLVGGVMNILPWGGPTARAMSVLHLDSTQLFNPLIPAMLVGLAWVFFVAWRFGKQERKRLGLHQEPNQAKKPMVFGITAGFPAPLPPDDETTHIALSPEDQALRRPRLLWINALLTIGLMVALVRELLPLPVLFMVAFALAALLNYPNLAQQRQRFAAHASNALSVAAMVFAAGIFTGILSGTHMVDAMAHTFVQLVPTELGPRFPVLTGLVSAPLTFFMSNDAFYFGILPFFTKAAAQFGITAATMGKASLLGQPVHLLSPLVPSTYLLVGLAGVEFAAHQRFTLKWACGTVLVMLLTCLLLGIVPW
ncbi:citrate-Mg2+:H+ or citrate-Ca2+:H+ symporter, CitMHS family [Hymenobacter gelipurpurascens]|uniref:Citrate-Mg2+:H+ or citrate-Ca2+:H+ symporter, CitMHS family n=1 Tax=Hymenobacter gelipurpurascens TaxID=89968 RepID=A0A212TIW4_9BACT|nr:CitMHS family transporter [Hymenobacter gelipurpurascens]SNC65923.1 citrate-Mg2+:H+ or citrate-Ca2+:H+ symporter, CitMHS family [Hymenobacter gelipurpurascens]